MIPGRSPLSRNNVVGQSSFRPGGLKSASVFENRALGGNRHDRSAAHTIEQVLLRGGFPELSAHPEVEVGGFYRSYIATYLERDLRQLLQVTNLRDYERFLRACALRTAQLPGVCDNPGFSSEVIITRKHTRFGESRA